MEYGLVAVWLLVFLGLALAATPLVTRLFPRWPTGGVGFALPVALLTLGVTAFWVGRVAYGPPALVAGLLVLVGLSVAVGLDRDTVRTELAALGGSSNDDHSGAESAVVTRLRGLADALRAGLRVDDSAISRVAVAETALVFLLAFGFLVAVRAVDPAIFPRAGEKFLDFGLLQSLTRADTLPPEDMWFAGEPVRYYYGGHLVSHLLAMLTGTPPRYAYNLALATVFATYVTGAFDLAGAVAASRGYDRRTAAWVGAFFVGLAGNVQTGGRLLLQALPSGLQSSAVAAIQPHVEADVAAMLSPDYWGPFRTMWNSSRVIPGTINEFPLFAFLNGDLHAHMVGPTFLLLAAAVAFALYRTPAEESGRRRALLFGVVPVIGAFQAVVNTWGFPTVFGLAWLALALAPAPPRSLLPELARAPLDSVLGRVDPREGAVADGGAAGTPDSGATSSTVGVGRRPVGGSRQLGSEIARPVVAAGLVGLAGVVAAVLASPFLLGAAQAGSERELALLAVADRSGFGGLLVVHGAFLLLFGGYLFDRIGDERPGEVVLALAVLLWTAQRISLPGLVLFGGLLLAGWIAARTPSERGGFETVLIVGGAGIALVVELVYLNEQAGPGRLNTVFKTYAQVWAIWAPAAGVAVAGLLRRVETPTVWPTPQTRHVLALLLVGVALAGAGGYATQTVPDHFTAGSGGEPRGGIFFGYPEEPTLNGTANVEAFHPGVAAGTNYLDRQPGTPVLLSAPGTGRYPAKGGFRNPPGMYGWGSNPASSLTGVPTVAGWGHEIGYRGLETYVARVRTVDAAYTNRTAAVSVMREYDVQYVWVGTAERNRYGSALVDFDSLSGVRAVTRERGVVLYEVDQAALSTNQTSE